MDCEQAIERLPWLLNGTLAADERRAVEAHVADCGRCAQDLAATRAAWKVFAQHVPTADLVAYAADEPTAVGKETIDRHLAGCPQCAAELEMARASRALSEHEEVALLPSAAAQAAAGGRRRAPRLWRSSALAAGLVGIVAIGGWVHDAGEVHALQARLETEHPGARQAALRGARPTAAVGSSPIAAHPAVVSLEPDREETAVRGEKPAAEIVPADADYLVLTLRPSERDVAGDHAAELVDAAGRVQPLTGRLFKDADGFYALGFPRRLLAPGGNEIRVYATGGGRRALVGRYALQG
jgi:anti-sigma factor RsiW